MFSIGQKVVCVNDEFANFRADQGIKKGEIYIIRWQGMFYHPVFMDEPNLCVRLEGIERDESPEARRFFHNADWLNDIPFYASRFRPLTDISVFTEMLKKVPENIDV